MNKWLERNFNRLQADVTDKDILGVADSGYKGKSRDVIRNFIYQ
jgi:hypothetical protein